MRYYIKKNTSYVNKKRLFRFIGLSFTFLGVIIFVYITFPLLSWQMYFAPVFASQDIATPIPKTTIVNPVTIQSLVTQAAQSSFTNYSDVHNWFPGFIPKDAEAKIPEYMLSIPKLSIKDAIVSTTDYNIDIHLVNYGGTGIPPENGNAVIFGHSTLPQFFNPSDYKTIFAKAYTLQIGDEILATVNGVTYKYKVYNTTVVDPTDTSIFSQMTDTSYITIVTCTPPGTTWKRLIIRSRLEKI